MAGGGRVQPPSQMWCLGDLVGYGPNPAECLRLLRDFDLTSVAGNHDYAAAGVIDAADFNGAAYAAIRWTAERLDAADRRFLSQLPIVEYLLHPSPASRATAIPEPATPSMTATARP